MSRQPRATRTRDAGRLAPAPGNVTLIAGGNVTGHYAGGGWIGFHFGE